MLYYFIHACQLGAGIEFRQNSIAAGRSYMAAKYPIPHQENARMIRLPANRKRSARLLYRYLSS